MKNKPYPKTPELDKMKAVQHESQIIGEFINSLDGQSGIHLCERCEGMGDNFWPTGRSIEKILADYFNIDLVKVEKERRAILESIRN